MFDEVLEAKEPPLLGLFLRHLLGMLPIGMVRLFI